MRTLAILCLITIFSWNNPTGAATIEELKGAYLINFIKFARFAPNVTDLTVCINQDTQLYEYIRKKLTSTINNIKIKLKNTSKGDELTVCNIFYSSQLGGIEANLKESLSITDYRGGGVIEFVEVDGKLRFYVDVARATEANVTFPVQVLNLAIRREELTFNEAVPSKSLNLDQSVDGYVTNSTINHGDTGRILFNLQTIG